MSVHVSSSSRHDGGGSRMSSAIAQERASRAGVSLEVVHLPPRRTNPPLQWRRGAAADQCQIHFVLPSCRESVVYWYPFSNPRTQCIHYNNSLVVRDAPRDPASRLLAAPRGCGGPALSLATTGAARGKRKYRLGVPGPAHVIIAPCTRTASEHSLLLVR